MPIFRRRDVTQQSRAFWETALDKAAVGGFQPTPGKECSAEQDGKNGALTIRRPLSIPPGWRLTTRRLFPEKFLVSPAGLQQKERG